MSEYTDPAPSTQRAAARKAPVGKLDEYSLSDSDDDHMDDDIESVEYKEKAKPAQRKPPAKR